MATFTLKTTAQVERSYEVEAEDEAQARKRLRTHFSDPGMLREGIVSEIEGLTDKTAQRIIEINGKAVKDTVPAQAAATKTRKARGQTTTDDPPAPPEEGSGK